ncbi:hypothetical protein [Methylocella sp.]|uniref:hypothetical protein n=1 Tax=Methylocella sp. TaxID=1978226 RepID=UPI0037837AD5
MFDKMRTTAIVAVSSLALVLPIATSGSASAQGWGRPGGWHGGGWHGGGWHGGWGRPGWGRPGWGGGWGAARWGGGWGPGWGWGGGWAGPAAAGLVGGLALGAIAANAAQPAYGGCVRQRQALYDQWGRFVGYRPVTVCY